MQNHQQDGQQCLQKDTHQVPTLIILMLYQLITMINGSLICQTELQVVRKQQRHILQHLIMQGGYFCQQLMIAHKQNYMSMVFWIQQFHLQAASVIVPTTW